MKILDRYILQTFLVSLAISMAAMMGIVFILDLAINVNRLLNLSPAVQVAGFWPVFASILSYYFYKAFDYFQWIAAPSLLVAAAASMVRLNRGRELVGIKAAGISLYRVLWPMIVVALLTNGFYVINQEVIIPANCRGAPTTWRSASSSPSTSSATRTTTSFTPPFTAPRRRRCSPRRA